MIAWRTETFENWDHRREQQGMGPSVDERDDIDSELEWRDLCSERFARMSLGLLDIGED